MTERKGQTAWVHCFSGVAGDMLLGALLDAGADLDAVRGAVDTLGIDGWTLDAEPVLRGGVAATRAVVGTPGEGHHHRTWSTIQTLLHEAGGRGLPDDVVAWAYSTFAALAEVEGELHRMPPDEVHFHEVGALDALVDVVGTCAALHDLGVWEVVCSPVATGHGSVGAAHGNLPVPAPATSKLLVGVPVVGLDVPFELATPTGVALVRALARSFGPMPPMTVSSTGLGAGGRELEGRPNVVQVLVGKRERPAFENAVLIEANVDDVTGEVLAHTIARLLEAGAADAWATPIVMKKGRPAHTVSVLADMRTAPGLASVLMAETGSLGVRTSNWMKWPLKREVVTVDVDGHAIRVKVTPEGRHKVEFDDAAAAAAALGRPVREVLVAAEAAAARS